VEYVLFFHVLAAFMLLVTVVVYSAVVLGAPTDRLTATVADRLWDVGGLGTLVLGIWLALDDYDLFDGWILAAIVLWIVATGLGVRSRMLIQEGGAAVKGQAALFHWARVVTVLLILYLMIFKPGAEL
jgi:uncharacterized membrane protein